ncbi:MAG: carbamoyltransferase HypF [Candidatus Bipolaricaulota bacterium]|nr:carbamoyltransferase HypF [Candidatus Bipolaricaulota bacterium]MBS3791660.1 carbamoyltransferase HypF [Candidatus Bipolaricaulota bacterium]
MTEVKARRFSITGVVQAVGFRPFVYRVASSNDLEGWVKNLGDAGVEIFVQGKEADIEDFVNDLENNNPPLARIDQINSDSARLDDSLEEFTIKKSSEGSSGSGTIPPDIATCDDCLEDVFGNSRYEGYWATSCVNCGPRFSVIRELPYDRDKTSMDEFPMCDDCHEEYTDPLDRRYHAQTIACPECGPELWYEPQSRGGRIVEDPIEFSAKKLKDDKILAIKGLGGTHLACNATNDQVVSRLREVLGRPNQPFALMATEEMVQRNARYTEEEFRALTGPRRPIVLLQVKGENWLSEEVSPGLHTVGIMLPYTALHHLIFSELEFPLVMTSANLPGQPMLIENSKIRQQLKDIVDGYMLHDRKVVSRVDDSVVRFSGGRRKFIRRSRGWVPEPIEGDLGDSPLLAVGAEQDNVIGLYKDGNVFLSQYLGDIEGPDDLEFLESALDRLLKLTSSSLPEIVAHDIHPRFVTTEKAKDWGGKTVPVQHHKAHVGSLLAEHDLSTLVAIVADGVGLGEDGKVRGGEVIKGSKDGFNRLGSLSPAYMPGGDLSTEHPARMVAGILYPLVERGELRNFESFISDLNLDFPKGSDELTITLNQLEQGVNSPVTTSAGRFLDAVSALLGLCSERTYEGEPAMKLESFARGGEVVEIDLSLLEQGDIPVLDQSRILSELIDLSENVSPEDVAATAQWALARGLTKIATRAAGDAGLNTVGFSGGVAFNDAISEIVEETVKKSGLSFVTNEIVPPGDGGIALGQLWIAGNNNGD